MNLPTRRTVTPRRADGPWWCAKAAHESPYGRIVSARSLTGEDFELFSTVPAGTSASLVLPDGTISAVGPGAHTLTCTYRAQELISR